MSHSLVELLARHLDAENRHDMDATLATLTPDCRFVDTVLGTFDGHAGAADYYRLWWDAFEMQVVPENLYVASERIAVAETRWQGRQVGTFLEVPASGRTVDIPVAIVVEVRDGLMATERLYWDGRSAAAQLAGA